jgi:hypothetical protein
LLLLADGREGNEDDQDNSSNNSESLQGEGATGTSTGGSGNSVGIHGDGGDSGSGEFKDGIILGEDGVSQDGVVDVRTAGLVIDLVTETDEDSVEIVSESSGVSSRRDGDVLIVGQTNVQVRKAGQAAIVGHGEISVSKSGIIDQAIFGGE